MSLCEGLCNFIKAVPGNPPQACKDPDYKELIEEVGGWCALPMG